MNIGTIYAVVAFVSMFQLLLTYNRSKKTQYKETIDIYFCKILLFFAAFCFVDCWWGICSAGYSFISPKFFTVVAYGYHSMCAVSAFVWFGYMLSYMGVQGRSKKYLFLSRYILISIQAIMVLSNVFLQEGFYVEDDLSYHMGKMRIYMYMVQFFYYIIIILYACIYGHYQQDKTKYKHTFLFSLVPLIFGIGQYLFYDVALYSLGFMVSAFIIYAFNVTEMREQYLTQRADDMNTYANIDAMTGLNNRRAYEDYLKGQPQIPTEDNFVYVSVDINGLKQANDNIGHEAGDELIKGAAECLNRCFGSYGNVYRTGGDEFSIMIFADEAQLKNIQNDFEETVQNWSGKLVNELAVSCGYAMKKEFPDMSILDISKKAEERMYKDKARYYANKGVDRRGRQEAHTALCALYAKIMKINLETGKYQMISMSEAEKEQSQEAPDNIFNWLYDFGMSGYVHKDDLQEYLRQTDKDYLREYFESGQKSLHIIYRRKNGDAYKRTIMEMIPAGDYESENQTLFLYVKEIE